MTTNVRFSKEKENQIVKMYLSGKNQKEIANEFNTFNTSIRRVLLRNNIPIVTSSERWRNMDINLFDDYNSIDVQYWLGVMCSDGCVTNSAIVFETIDREWVEKFRDFVNPSLNLNITQPKKGNTLYRFSTRCKGIDLKLEEYGIVPNKSLILDFKYPITWHFLRGVFDGDGCVTKRNKTGCGFSILSGSQGFRDKLFDFLIEEGFTPTKTQNTCNRLSTMYYVNMFKKQELDKLFSLLYQEANTNFLQRKYLKFGSLIGKLIR